MTSQFTTWEMASLYHLVEHRTSCNLELQRSSTQLCSPIISSSPGSCPCPGAEAKTPPPPLPNLKITLPSERQA